MINVLTDKHLAAKEISMSNITIETPAADAQPETETKPKKPAKGRKSAAKKAKPAKKAKAAKKMKPAAKMAPAAERSNKKAEVIALMKRAKGVTLAEIMELTGGRSIPSGVSSASSARRASTRSSRPRTPKETGSTKSRSSAILRQPLVQTAASARC